MDGARKKVRKLAQHFLPEQPHHLALSPTERYPEPTTLWQHNSRLQYSTYLSDADRGVLLTRPYYDIRQEPESATASNNDSAHAGSRPEMKKAVTKMSFKDYQNKQKKLSESPPDSGASAPRATDAKSQSGEGKPSRDGPRREELSSKASGHRQDAKVAPRQEINGERSKLKTAPIGAPSPSLENKKRSADHDDSPRPQKRNKSDSVSQVDRVHTPRSDTQRGSQDSASTQTKQPNRDNKLLANGRSNLEGGKDGARPTGASPRPVVNGTKSQNTSSSQTTPKKPDSGGKSTVPPLLSPLRLPLGEDRGPKSPRKRPTEGNTALKAPPKPIKSDTNSSQKQKHSSIIPPLLSPTLPPVLEQEIARMKRTSSKGDSSQGTRQSSESPGSIKKSRAPQDDDADRPRAPQKPSLIVTLKYKKRNALRVQRLLALPPTHEKDARRKERSESMEDTPPPARKHLVEDAIAVKRPKTSSDKTVASKSLAAPSTPVKTYSMSRGPSSNSQTAQTPGDSTTLTPGTNDRPPTSHSGENGAVAPSSSTLRSRHAQFTSLGTKLKHDRDNIIKARGASSRSGEFLSLLTPSERKRVAALSLEMVMAYMIAFKSLNQARALDRKACDFKPWEDLLPHLVELRNFTRAYQPLDALAVQLRAVCLEQLADAYSASSISSQDAAQVAGPKLVKLNRKRGEAWAEAYQCLLGIADEGMKATVGPWYGADEVVRVLLPVIRKWADKEGSSWRPEIVLP